MEYETIPEGALSDPGEGRAVIHISVTTSDGCLFGGVTVEVGPFDDCRHVWTEVMHAIPHARVAPAEAVRAWAVQRTLF